MNLMGKYIIRSVTRSTLIILLVMLGVVAFIELANELRSTGRGGYDVMKAIQYVLLILPRDIYSFFPMAGLVGAIVGLGMLASSSELVIMRATGLPVSRITSAVIVAAMMLCLCITVVGEAVGPKLYKHAELMRAKAMYGSQAIETGQGVWMRIGDDYLQINKVIDRHRLVNVTRYHMSKEVLQGVSFAKRLNYVQKQWVAFDVVDTKITPKQVTSVETSAEVWDMNLKPEVLSFGNDDPMGMSLIALHKYIQYRVNVGLSASEYWLVFWQRIFQPLATIVMILLAVPFIFGSLRSGTMGFRILVGIVLSLGFYLFSQLSGQISLVYQIPAMMSALLPILIFAVAGLVLMCRVR